MRYYNLTEKEEKFNLDIRGKKKEISVNPFGIVTVNCGKEITFDNDKIL